MSLEILYIYSLSNRDLLLTHWVNYDIRNIQNMFRITSKNILNSSLMHILLTFQKFYENPPVMF